MCLQQEPQSIANTYSSWHTRFADIHTGLSQGQSVSFGLRGRLGVADG
jgi:hypothetical protein